MIKADSAGGAGGYHAAALPSFFQCVRTNQQPVVGVREGRDATLVGLLVRKSVYDQKVVTMDQILKNKA